MISKITKLRGPLHRIYEMQPLPGAYHNLLLRPGKAGADVPDYIFRSTVAASVGGLLLVVGILSMVLEGFSFLNLIPFLPAFPGTVAIIHSLRVRRFLSADDTEEARRASNYAETWARISLFTVVGIVISGLIWLIAVTLVLILLVILVMVAAVLVAILTMVLLMSLSSSSDSSSSPERSDSRDSDETVSRGRSEAPFSSPPRHMSSRGGSRRGGGRSGGGRSGGGRGR